MDSLESFLRACKNHPLCTGAVFFEDDEDDVFEDDGTLHVVRHGFRVCFDIRNEVSVQNNNAIKILEVLNIKDFKPERVFVDESDEDDEYVCPHCGRC